MHESREVVCGLLNKLRDMRQSYKTLEARKIGITINALKKHESKDVKQIAKMMIRDWKRMVDEHLDSDGKKSVVVLEEEECGSHPIALFSARSHPKMACRPDQQAILNHLAPDDIFWTNKLAPSMGPEQTMLRFLISPEGKNQFRKSVTLKPSYL
nr:probable mediator of RNA polymerase II transcription subunit 26c [Tanacetum cinerariifolium]